MEPTRPQDEELLRERLEEAAAADVLLDQMRGRYDDLHRDYERLLARLETVEEQLAEPAPSDEPETHTQSLALEQLVNEPLRKLREEYAAAGARIQSLIAGIDRMMGGTMKGQRPASEPGDVAHPLAAAEPDDDRPRKVGMQVHGKGFGELLDFQEKLSSLAGVSRVSIVAIDAERANLVVELSRDVPQ